MVNILYKLEQRKHHLCLKISNCIISIRQLYIEQKLHNYAFSTMQVLDTKKRLLVLYKHIRWWLKYNVFQYLKLDVLISINKIECSRNKIKHLIIILWIFFTPENSFSASSSFWNLFSTKFYRQYTNVSKTNISWIICMPFR